MSSVYRGAPSASIDLTAYARIRCVVETVVPPGVPHGTPSQHSFPTDSLPAHAPFPSASFRIPLFSRAKPLLALISSSSSPPAPCQEPARRTPRTSPSAAPRERGLHWPHPPSQPTVPCVPPTEPHRPAACPGTEHCCRRHRERAGVVRGASAPVSAGKTSPAPRGWPRSLPY